MLVVDASGPATLESAWLRYSRASAWPSWAPQIRGVTGAGDPLAVGDHGWVHGPLLLRVPYRIEEVDPVRHRWRWRVGVGPASVVMEHGVEPTATGTRAWVRIGLPAPLALPYAPLARHALRRLVRA